MYDWKESMLPPASTMLDAIYALNKKSRRTVLVVDDNAKLLGTITDGDIRRSLANHYNMDTLLTEIMCRDPITAPINSSKDTILSLMKEKDLLQVPIVDDKGCVHGIDTLQHLLSPQKHDTPIFLMAGGFGKRLRPLTHDIPKPLLKVGTKPILETILTQFIDYGFQNFYISTHYKAEMVRKHFGNGQQWGVNIQYVHEEEPLGTAGSLGLLPSDLSNVPLIMMNGDLLTKVNFEQLLQYHNEHPGIATMCVREYDFQVPYGVIESEGHSIKKIIEKPIHNFFVNAGIYVLEPDLVNSVNGNDFLDMPDLLEKRINNGDTVNMFPIHEYWLDIGQMDEYEKAHKDYSKDFIE